MKFSEAFNPIRVLTSTFKTMGKNPGPLWGGAILLLIVEILAYYGLLAVNWVAQTRILVGVNPHFWPQNYPGPLGVEMRDWFQEYQVLLAGGGALVFLIFLLVTARIIPGLLHNLRDVLETGSTGSEGIFSHRGLFGLVLKMKFFLFVISIIVGIPIFLFALAEGMINSDGNPDASLLGLAVKSGGSFVWWVVMIYFLLGISLTEPAAVYEKLEPVDALKRSWELVRGNRWRLLLYQLFIMVLILAGFLMCCVGVFATGSFARMMTAEAYLQLTSEDEALET